MTNTRLTVEVVGTVGDDDLTDCAVLTVASAAVDVAKVRVAIRIGSANCVGITKARARRWDAAISAPVGCRCRRGCVACDGDTPSARSTRAGQGWRVAGVVTTGKWAIGGCDLVHRIKRGGKTNYPTACPHGLRIRAIPTLNISNKNLWVRPC